MFPTHSNPIRVLHVDDDPAILELTAAFLARTSDRIETDTVTDARACLDRFDPAAVDCIVSDFDMPVMDGLELLAAIRADHPRFPFILFTGKGTEAIASRAIGAGVTDYLQKGGSEVYGVLVNRITNAIEQYTATRDLVRFRQAVERAGHAIYMTDATGVITYVNPAFEAVTGFAEVDAVGETPAILSSGEHDDAYFERLWATITAGEVWEETVINRRADGERYTAHQTIAPVGPAADGLAGYVAIQQDVTAG